MKKETSQELKILCPFCSAVYTAEMLDDLYSSGGCETCGCGGIWGEITIECANCKRVVYKKEY